MIDCEIWQKVVTGSGLKDYFDHMCSLKFRKASPNVGNDGLDEWEVVRSDHNPLGSISWSSSPREKLTKELDEELE
ncbi:hypothetical protein AGMMS49593_10490 [Endomicrobiia bacterium]|nr:hypothetical protein AGMMS49593_10490 [Endomicrobiia bacterium]